MNLTSVILLFVVLVSGIGCKRSSHKRRLATKITTKPRPKSYFTEGFFGGFYLENHPNSSHYIHGVPRSSLDLENYYQSYFHAGNDTSALGWYLGYGLKHMKDPDFSYKKLDYYFTNRSIAKENYLRLDATWKCHPDSTHMCPENTETVCLRNGTVYCMSQISYVSSCFNQTEKCVNTTVPCVYREQCETVWEEVSLPCFSTVRIVDIFEDKNDMTVGGVGAGFVLIPALAEEHRIYCVTVIADPSSSTLT